MTFPLARTPAFTASVLISILCTLTHGIPLTYQIKPQSQECMYERLEAGEMITMSAIIVSGVNLRGDAVLEGPVSPLESFKEPGDQRSGASYVKDNIERYEAGRRWGKPIFVKDVDRDTSAPPKFDLDVEIAERLDFMSSGYEADDFFDDDDDDFMGYDDDDGFSIGSMGADERRDFQKEQEERRREMKQALQERQERKNRMIKERDDRREMKEARQQQRRDGEPWQVTVGVGVAGWYRGCLKNVISEVSVEMELRKSSEMGPPDEKSGHIMTFEHHAMMNNERMERELPEDAATEHDLKGTNEMIRKLNRLVEQIKRKQSIARHEVSMHSSINERSHSRMMWNSFFETAALLLITSFQIYAIKRWFKGNSMLGR